MTEVLINNFEYIMKVRERVIFGLVFVTACFFAGYVCIIEKSASNAAAATALQSALARENQTVSNLSLQYVALSKNVTLDSALAQGFKEAPVSAFIIVPTPPANNSATLSINTVHNAF